MALGEIEARGHRALLVGGTGLYLKAVVDRLRLPGRFPAVRRQLEAELLSAGAPALHRRLAQVDPVAAARIEPSNGRRVVRALEVCRGSGRPFSSYGPGIDTYPDVDIDLVGLAWPRPELDRRIAARYVAQLDAGFLHEVEVLAARPGGLGVTARQALGYRELLAHLDGRMSLDEAVDTAVRRTRRFARRQERWFRRDPRVRWQPVERQCQSRTMSWLSAPDSWKTGRCEASGASESPAARAPARPTVMGPGRSPRGMSVRRAERASSPAARAPARPTVMGSGGAAPG